MNSFEVIQIKSIRGIRIWDKLIKWKFLINIVNINKDKISCFFNVNLERWNQKTKT